VKNLILLFLVLALFTSVLARHSALTTRHHRKAECGPEEDEDPVLDEPNDEAVPYLAT
jgi:hypothetical protein